jgi:hypothetical protein
MNPYLAPAPAASYEAHAHGGAPYGNAPDERGAQVSEAAVEVLRQTRPWVMFLGVMSFIGSAFMLLGGVLVMAAGSLAPSGAPFPSAALGAAYIPLAFVYIYPGMKLWSYGAAINRLLASRTSVDLEAALAQQKSFWKFVGILTVVMLALYALLFVGIMVVGIAATRH